MIVIDAREIWNPACNTPAPSYGGLMINLANRLAREETDADKQEFVRGLASLNQNGGKKIVLGFAAGYLLTNWLRNRG
jgi:hypothetical protein